VSNLGKTWIDAPEQKNLGKTISLHIPCYEFLTINMRCSNRLNLLGKMILNSREDRVASAFSLYLPNLTGNSAGDWFAADCIHRHTVNKNNKL
jgi:hypothetical protein